MCKLYAIRTILTIFLITALFMIIACAPTQVPIPAPAPSKTATLISEPPPMPPLEPSNLTAEVVLPTQVKLHWFDNSNNERGFTLYRDNKVIATLPENTTAYEDADLKTATTYNYMVKAYNEVGESGASSYSIRTPNPPIAVRLDKIGVYDNREDWTRGEDGEVYVGIIVTDGKTIVEERYPEGEGQYYKLKKNETVNIGTTIFSLDEVGEYIRIAAIGYEDDGGQGEMLLYQALGAAGEAYISGGASTLLEMADISLGNLLAKLFGAEDDWLGSYENVWNSKNNWGIGQYRDIVLQDERGVDCLRLWFTIESPIGNVHIAQPEPTPFPTPKPTTSLSTKYKEVSFTLSVPKGEEYDEYSFPIYLKNNQTLHLSWTVEQGDEIWFGFLTPSGKYIGLKDKGILEEGSCSQLGAATIIFKPSEYDWGEGYYEMKPHISTGGGHLTQAQVAINYWIDD
jgi:hypothetical protein